MGKFFSAVEAVFKKLFGSAPGWARTASITLTLIGPLVLSIVKMVAGDAGAAAAQAVLTEVQNDLALSGTLLQQAQSGDTSVLGRLQAALTDVSNNLTGLLTAGHIKDQNTLNNVQVAVQTIDGELQAILKVIPQIQAAPAPVGPATATSA